MILSIVQTSARRWVITRVQLWVEHRTNIQFASGSELGMRHEEDGKEVIVRTFQGKQKYTLPMFPTQSADIITKPLSWDDVQYAFSWLWWDANVEYVVEFPKRLVDTLNTRGEEIYSKQCWTD